MRDSARPGIDERLSSAFVSDDLSMVPERIGDADYLTALGMAGARRSLGATVLHLDLAGDRGSVRDALAAVQQVVRKLAARDGWVVDPGRAKSIATEALHYYVKPACVECCGRGFLGLDGGRRSVPRPCSACSASGRRPIKGKYSREVRAVVSRLEEMRETASHEVRRRLRSR